MEIDAAGGAGGDHDRDVMSGKTARYSTRNRFAALFRNSMGTPPWLDEAATRKGVPARIR